MTTRSPTLRRAPALGHWATTSSPATPTIALSATRVWVLKPAACRSASAVATGLPTTSGTSISTGEVVEAPASAVGEPSVAAIVLSGRGVSSPARLTQVGKPATAVSRAGDHETDCEDRNERYDDEAALPQDGVAPVAARE